jgi:uncharacterized membrane protein YoaT (DUF817 family)
LHKTSLKKKKKLKHKNLIYVLGWFLNVFDLQYDSWSLPPSHKGLKMIKIYLTEL